jgi:hypothetical protein
LIIDAAELAKGSLVDDLGRFVWIPQLLAATLSRCSPIERQVDENPTGVGERVFH